MPEPDPYASPFQPVDLPGQGRANAPLPPDYRLPAPMPPVHPNDLAPRRPVTMTVASWCWIAGAALVVFALPGLAYTGMDVLTDDLVRDSAAGGDPLTRGEAELIARFTPLVLVPALAVVSVPFVLAAAKLRSGRNWARVTLTVLGPPVAVFGLVTLLVFAFGGLPYVHWLVGVAWSWVFLGVSALGFVAMYLPASNAYARSVTR